MQLFSCVNHLNSSTRSIIIKCWQVCSRSSDTSSNLNTASIQTFRSCIIICWWRNHRSNEVISTIKNWTTFTRIKPVYISWRSRSTNCCWTNSANSTRSSWCNVICKYNINWQWRSCAWWSRTRNFTQIISSFCWSYCQCRIYSTRNRWIICSITWRLPLISHTRTINYIF